MHSAVEYLKNIQNQTIISLTWITFVDCVRATWSWCKSRGKTWIFDVRTIHANCSSTSWCHKYTTNSKSGKIFAYYLLRRIIHRIQQAIPITQIEVVSGNSELVAWSLELRTRKKIYLVIFFWILHAQWGQNIFDRNNEVSGLSNWFVVVSCEPK